MKIDQRTQKELHSNIAGRASAKVDNKLLANGCYRRA